METPRRFDLFYEPHIGFGVRWRSLLFDLELSIAFPLITVTIGLGRRRV